MRTVGDMVDDRAGGAYREMPADQGTQPRGESARSSSGREAGGDPAAAGREDRGGLIAVAYLIFSLSCRVQIGVRLVLPLVAMLNIAAVITSSVKTPP